jgi:hypothetical protein
VLAHQRPYPPPLRQQAAHQIAADMARSACDSYQPFALFLFAHWSCDFNMGNGSATRWYNFVDFPP